MLIPANDIVLITNTAIRFSLLGFMEPSSISGSKIWDERKPRIIQRVFSGYFPGSRNLQWFGFQKVDKVETLQRSSKKRARTINPARIPAKIAQLRLRPPDLGNPANNQNRENVSHP